MKRPSILESNRKMNESGFSSSIFRPNARITLDAMMTLVWRLCRSVGALRAIKALDPWTEWISLEKSFENHSLQQFPCSHRVTAGCGIWALPFALRTLRCTLRAPAPATLHSSRPGFPFALYARHPTLHIHTPHSARYILHPIPRPTFKFYIALHTPRSAHDTSHLALPATDGHSIPTRSTLYAPAQHNNLPAPRSALRTPHSTFPTPYPHSTPPSLLYAPQSNVLYITLALCTCFTLSVTFYTWHPSLFVKGRVQIGNFGVTDDGHGWISRRHVNFIILSTAHHEVIGRRNSSDAEAKPCVFTGMVAPRVTTLWFHEKLCSKSPCQCWSIGTAKHWCCDAPALRNCSWRLPNAL